MKNLVGMEKILPDESEIKSYSYSQSLKNSSGDIKNLYTKAQVELKKSRGSISNTKIKKYDIPRIRGLAEQQQNLELQFFQNYLNIEPEKSNNIEKGKWLVQQFNSWLNDAEQLKAQLDNLDNIKEDYKNDYIYTMFNEIIPDFLKELKLTEVDLTTQQDILEYIQDQLRIKFKEVINTKKKNGNDEKKIEIYNQLNHILRNWKTNNFGINVLNSYGITKNINDLEEFKSISELTDDQINSILQIKIKNAGAFVNEEYTAQSMANEFSKNLKKLNNGTNNSNRSKLRFIVESTGGKNNMKADQVMTLKIGGKKPTSLFNSFTIDNTKEKSKRIQNIEALKSIVEKAEKMKTQLIFISDKNYKISGYTFRQKGFSAESPTLEVLEKVLKKNNATRIEDLIYILSNSGRYLINGYEIEEANQYIAANIGSFLFDDVQIELGKNQSSSNALHLFNLNGFYVPLSTFLFAVVNALENIKSNDLDKFVNISLYDAIPPRTVWEKEVDIKKWEAYHDYILKNSKVSIHFLKDFVNFIQEQFK